MIVGTIGPINREWLRFAAAILPDDASETQRIEMRRAFFAGVHWMMDMNLQVGDKSISEQDGIKTLSEIADECDDFFQLLRKGKV